MAHGLDEFAVNALVHQEAGGGDAHLAGVAEFGATNRLDRLRHIGVFTNDHRRVAAQFHRDAFHVLTGHRGQLLAHGGGAGEGDLADDGVGDQVARNVSGVAIHQAQHAFGQTGVGKGLDQGGGARRGFFRALDQHGAASGKCRADFAHHLVDGEVPGRERCHRTHRVFQHHLADGEVAARGHQSAVGA